MFRRNDPASELLDMIGSNQKPATLLERLGLKRRTVILAPPARRKDRRGDLMIAGLGIAIGLASALFPWYIFFNPEKFGVRALKFAGDGQSEQSVPLALGQQPERVGAPMSVEDIPPMQLDLFATGSLRPVEDQGPGVPGVGQQPFPGPAVNFTLVHVANGRAMVQDQSGLWVVQRGSVLPDSSRVASIEQRDGKWVLVTSREDVVELQR